MKKRAYYLIILFIALISVVQSMAQSSQADVVCMGTSKKYYVDATFGSSYIWKINGGSPEASTTNSVDINWTTSGIYTLTVQEKTKDNCLGPIQSLQVTVIELPTLQLTSEIGTESQTICLGGAIDEVTYSFGGGATGVTVIGLPDGVNSVVNGTTVTLSGIPTASGNYTITTVGGAPFAEASLNGNITVNQLSTATIGGTTIVCQNAALPVITFTGAGGTAPYTFTYKINGGSNQFVTTSVGNSVTVPQLTATPGPFVYNLLSVQDSSSTRCVNLQADTATIIVNPLPTATITGTTDVCQNASYPDITFTGANGTAPYIFTYTINGGSTQTVTSGGNSVTVPQPTRTNGAFVYNLLSVQDSSSTRCSNAQSGNAVIIVKLPSTSITNAAICEGDSYSFNETTYTTAGTYSAVLTNAQNCDSTATLNLTVKLPTTSTTDAAICQGDSYVFNGTIYTTTGSYTAALVNAQGCDSTATLNLTVNLPSSSTTNASICQDDSYLFNGTTYTTAGTYSATLTNVAGCDSTATLELTVVFPSSSVTQDIVNSTNLPYVWNKMSFTESGTYTSLGELVNSMGCDSIAKLILIVNLSTKAITNATVCASELPYIWNGSSYYNSGTYKKTMTNVFGENVPVTLNLKVITAIKVSQTVRLVDGEKFTINDHVYDQAGIYTDLLKTVSGCDSTVVTDLSFIKIPNTITPNNDGYNDLFMKGYHVKIYNRNGILIYDGWDGWNGKYENREDILWLSDNI